STMVHASMQGELDTARKAHNTLFDITKMFFEQGNPGGVKAALSYLDIMDDFMRLPLYPISQDLRMRIEEEVDRILG
ncbi:MAG: dihydrodipicolinate synthase family protein, partial [Bacteroidota bacterium]